MERKATMNILKRLVPAPARRAVKKWLAEWEIERALEPLRDTGTFSTHEIDRFSDAWGNRGFSADKRYLSETIRLIGESRSDVLELGTGATTLVAGVLAERYGFDVYCLEQDPAWAASSRRAIAHSGLNRVRVLETPLRSLGEYMWYDVGQHRLPRNFGLIICDGPFISNSFGEPFHSMWRYGALPFLRQLGSAFDALLLDDVDDPRAAAVLDRWNSEFGIRNELISTSEGKCSVIRQAHLGPTEVRPPPSDGV
jgi:hypothetical protein